MFYSTQKFLVIAAIAVDRDLPLCKSFSMPSYSGDAIEVDIVCLSNSADNRHPGGNRIELCMASIPT